MSSEFVNQRITNTILPHYEFAYIMLNEDIVQPLLTVDTESDQGIIKILVKQLARAARMVRDQLHDAAGASERLSTAVDKEVIQLSLSFSNQEEQVRDSQAAVNQANKNVQSTQHEVNIAEAAVRDGEHSRNVANHEVHRAHEAVKDARVCGLGRRKRSFFGDLLEVINPVNIIREVIVKPVCSVVNGGGIDNAKDRRALAEQTLHQAQQRLQTHRENHDARIRQRNAAQAQLHVSSFQLLQIKSALDKHKVKQLLVASLAKHIKDIEVHLSNVLVPSRTLLNETAQLINFKLVIDPLNGIYEEMIKNNVTQSFGFKISAETARQINENLQKLAEKMPEMPLNMASETDSEETHGSDNVAPNVNDAPNRDSDEDHGFQNVDTDVNDSPKTESEETHGSENIDTDVDDERKADSEEDHDSNNVDTAVNDAPKTDSEETHGSENVDTDSEEIHSSGNVDTDVSDATKTDSEETHGSEHVDTDTTDATKTDSEETHNSDNVDTVVDFDDTSER